MNFVKYPSINWQTTLGALGGSSSNLYIMRGPIPSNEEIKKMASNIFESNTYRPNRLLAYALSGSILISGSGFAVSSLPFRAAQQSGVATWFAISDHLNNFIIGDISDKNGNGALTIESTTIVAGQFYEIRAFSITFPTEFVIA